MTGVLTFTLHCVPTAQARPRHTRTKSGIDLTYKSAGQKGNEATLHALLAPHVPDAPFTGGVGLVFTAVLPIPKSVSGKRRAAMLCGRELFVKKPDLDNLAKQLKDAMTAMRFWNDDRQVVRLECEKVYGEEPCWLVAVEDLSGGRA